MLLYFFSILGKYSDYLSVLEQLPNFIGGTFAFSNNFISFDIEVSLDLKSSFYPQSLMSELIIMKNIHQIIHPSSSSSSTLGTFSRLCQNGITCFPIEDGRYQVVKEIDWSSSLNLNNSSLDSFLILSDLQYLESLDLSDNNMNGHLVSFDQFPSLKYLNLQSNES